MMKEGNEYEQYCKCKIYKYENNTHIYIYLFYKQLQVHKYIYIYTYIIFVLFKKKTYYITNQQDGDVSKQIFWGPTTGI